MRISTILSYHVVAIAMVHIVLLSQLEAFQCCLSSMHILYFVPHCKELYVSMWKSVSMCFWGGGGGGFTTLKYQIMDILHYNYIFVILNYNHLVLQDVVNDRIKHCLKHVAGDVDECSVCSGTGKCRLY